jgi:glycosyltransferase involved in cell wall biosynthesis
MKILCVIDSLGSGGAQRQIVGLALGFKEQGHTVAFLTYHHEPFYSNLLEREDIHVFCLQEPNYLKRLLKMRRYIRRGNYDAVLSFLEACNFICEISGLPFRKWKLIVGERDANPNIRKSLKLIIYRWFHLLADYVVANSHANMEMVCLLNPLLSERKCRVIYNIVDFDRCKPINDYMYRENNKFKLTIAASHQFKKNLRGLVEAINLLNQNEKSQLKIEWYGDGVQEPYFDNSFKESQLLIKKYELESMFQFFPATKNINHAFQCSDAIGLFSFYEGLPNVICEAMAFAKPVVCTAVSDLSIFLSHNTKLLSTPSDVESIKKALSYLLSLDNETLRRIGNENLSIAKLNFEKSDKISKYISLMN